MSYIYKITNNINGHAYIGKTDRSISERWREHKKDANRPNFQNRPLYRAINKYGIQNFIIEEIEECDNDIASEKEKYWIKYYDTFNNGYNATIGGDGQSYLDYMLIYKTYLKCKSRAKTAELLHLSREHINSIIRSFKEQPYSNHESLFKAVAKIDKDTNEILKIYKSISEAEEDCKTGRHISAVCQGKRKTAGGYKWEYI